MKNRTFITSLILLVVFLLSISSCDDDTPPAGFTGTIVSSNVSGNADDGDSTTPADSYGGNDHAAEDSKTKAASTSPTYNTLSGSVEAETLNPGGNTITDDEARGSSFNRVLSSLKVNRAGVYTFNISLNADNIDIKGDGNVKIRVRANVMNSDGTSFPSGDISDITFEAVRNAAGGIDIVIANDTNNTEHPDNNSDYQRRISGPNGGIQLRPGDYSIEFELRLVATASTSQGPNNQANRAAVDSVKASIELR